MKLPALLRFQQKDTGYPFVFLLLAALAALALAVYAYLAGPDQALPWEKVADLQQVNFPTNRFDLLLQSLEIRVKGFLVTERFEVGLPRISSLPAMLLLVFVSISAVFYLTVVSTFRQLPFFAALLLWMLFLASFNFDLLGIFPGSRQYILMAMLVATGGTAFAFQAFFPQVSIRLRLLVFGSILLALGLFVFRASPLPPGQTALQLSNYGSLGCMAAAAVFILWVAYENIHGLLWFNTQAQQPQRRFSRWQFILISSLYLVNLTLLFLKNTWIFVTDIILLNEFLILACSALVGFWGTRQRERLYGRFISFEPGAAFLYLSFAIITALSIGYAFVTANDPMIRAVSDLIVFSHLTFGAAFLLYLLINFGALLRQKLRVFKVVYDPKVLPFFTVVLAGLVGFMALLLQTNLMLPRKAMAGYHNYLGDFYKKTDNLLLAEKFYTEANVYNNNNLKSIFSLAAIYNEKLFYQSEIKALKKGIGNYANDKIFVRLANKYPDRQQLFEQLFVLQQGVKRFPNSAALLNNLALLYGSTAMLDSATYYFDRAQRYSKQPEVIQNNRLAFYLMSGQGTPATEMARHLGDQAYQPLQTNLLLLQGFNGQKLLDKPIELPQNPVLSPVNFALTYQAALQSQTLSDRTTLKKLNQYLKTDGNEAYQFDLSLIKAFVQQRLGQALSARTTLENLATTETSYAGYLLDIIGLQLMQQKLYKAAAMHFAQARDKGWHESGGHLLMALALQPDQRMEALLEAAQLRTAEDPDIATLARQLNFVLQARPVQVVTQPSDSLKVLYLQVNQGQNLLTDQEFLAITSTVNQPELKLLAEKELASFYVAGGNYPEAARVIEVMLPRLTKQDQLLSEVNLLQADILLRNNNLNELQQALEKMYLTEADKPKKLFYLAQAAERRNRLAEARRYYDRAVQALPAHEAGVLAAAAFYSNKMRNSSKAYELLVNSITYNPYNPEVYKAYILQSIASGYSGFAESALEELARLIPPGEMEAFRQEVRQHRARRQAALDQPR